MPTGYTAGVKDGTLTDFRTFLLQCARAFGATIMQREDPMDIAPKYREMSDFYVDHFKKSIAELQELRSLTDEECEKRALAEYENGLAYALKVNADKKTERARYNAMLRQVKKWEPPTPDHNNLKDFMIKQLNESIDFDTKFRWSKPRKMTGAQWRKLRIEVAQQSMERDHESLLAEINRTHNSNKWIDSLYESIKNDAKRVTTPEQVRPHRAKRVPRKSSSRKTK